MSSLLFFVVCVNLLGCDSSPDAITFAGDTMGTRYHVTVVPRDTYDIENLVAETLVAKNLAESIQQELDMIEQAMSTYRQDSELSRVNLNLSEEWQPISPIMAEVLAEAIIVGGLTEGALDITVGPLVDLWGFGPTARQTMPDPSQIETLLARDGFGKIQLQLDPPAIRKPAQLQMDLSAIAKGYAVDRVGKMLLDHGLTHFLVEVGGEVVTSGRNRKDKTWRLGVEVPSFEHSGVQQAILVSGKGVATSGDYRNYFEENGIRYSHLIDPRTGYPIANNVASVTVIADTGMRADGLATALSVMGAERALLLAERESLAIFLIVKEDGKFITQYSSAFAQYLGEP